MGELPALCAALYGGLIIGVLYDALRPLRVFSSSRIWNALVDIIYYALVLFVAALTLFYINGGVPRAYLLLGLGLGAYIYAHFVSRFLMALVANVKKTVANRRRMD